MTWLDDVLGVKDILQAGTAFTRRHKLNFIGSKVTVADNPAQQRTDVTIADSVGSLGTVANAAALAALSVTAADVGSSVLQTDTQELWVLMFASPVAWRATTRIYTWTVANDAALAALSVTSTDVGRCAYQSDLQEVWFLAGTSPAKWIPLTRVMRTTVANAAALAALSVTASDVGRFVYQSDTRELWFLAATGPAVWLPTGRRGFGGSRTITGNDTLVLADAGGKIYSNAGSGHTLTVPPNASVAFDGNDVVTVLQQGAGAFTLTQGSGVTIVPPSGKTLVSNGVGAVVGLTPRPGTLNTWNAYGDLV